MGYRRGDEKYDYKPEYTHLPKEIILENTHTENYTTNVGLGLNYFITQNIILKAYLGQLIEYSYKKEGDNYSKEFEFDLNSHRATFGIAYKF